jgi:predicted homoserine dehydrogenase-like protein
VTEVIGAAKRDLKAGSVIDGGGGYTVYGVNDRATVTKRENCVPFGLLDGAKLVKNVERDQVITHDMVELKTDTLLYHLRMLQDKVIQPAEVE